MSNWQGSSLPDPSYRLEAATELHRRREARRSLHEFVRQGWSQVESVPFVDNWHVGAVCEHLQAVTEGQIKLLVINIPPGFGKSLLTCIFWPAWEWTLDPKVRWLFASYDQRLSTRDAVRCRTLLGNSWYKSCCRREFRLNDDQNQKTYYETDHGGYRLATSVGGHASGEHPDRIVCDDPHNVGQAESPAERRSVLDWWDLSISTRGVARGVRRVIVMQRLHADDLAGHVLAQGDAVHLCLPMRYEPGRMVATPLGWTDPRRQEGELLSPVQFNAEVIERLEKSLGAYGAAGQLQQRPVPRQGGMFKREWFNRIVRAAPYGSQRVRYWDRAATADGGCYTAGTLVARSADGNWYVEHVVHGQWGPDERDRQIMATAKRDRARYGPNYDPAIWIEQEPGSSGIDAYRYIARQLAGFRVGPDRPTGPKEVRAEPWASQCAAGNVYLVDDGTWDLVGWIEEHCLFPLGKLKDRVDSASGAFGKLVQTRPAALRVIGGGRSRSKRLRIVLGSAAQLELMPVEQNHVLVSITDPPPVGKSRLPRPGDRLLASVELAFADIDPAAHQETWQMPVAPYNRPAEELVLDREMGKKLWSQLLRRRDPIAEVFVLQDENERRALSVAYGIADALDLPRRESIYRLSDLDWMAQPKDPAPNRHIYDMTKRTRAAVI
jgi:predicted phage terminase large subunit-like protein